MPTSKDKVPLTVGQAKAAGWIALQAHCTHHTTQIPWTMLAGGDDRTLSSIVAKLRCRRCGKPPSEVDLHREVADNGRGPPTMRRLSIRHLTVW